MLLALIFLLNGNKTKNSGDDNIPHSDSVFYDEECTAELALMRYSDLNLKCDNAFTEELRDVFCYDDSIDNSSDSVLHIFPTSKYYSFEDLDHDLITNKVVLDSMPYHNAVLRLTMHNKLRNTLVFNHLFVEVKDIKYDETPVCGFDFNDKFITIINQSERNFDCDFKYSLLKEGESFIRYKNETKLNIADRATFHSAKDVKLKAKFNDKFNVKSVATPEYSRIELKECDYKVIDVSIVEGETEINKHNNIKLGVRDDFNHSL
ncbi:MAG: hypothetical protein IK092_02335, partial [Muribaculaceae bacterium]|nr:hypothetical protein [Muribaculaceae bacterium]